MDASHLVPQFATFQLYQFSLSSGGRGTKNAKSPFSSRASLFSSNILSVLLVLQPQQHLHC